jgi:hypothetical protein
VGYGAEFHCDMDADFVCPAGNCDLHYRWADGGDGWGRSGWSQGKHRPTVLWWRYSYVLLSQGSPPPGPLWAPPTKTASTSATTLAASVER